MQSQVRQSSKDETTRQTPARLKRKALELQSHDVILAHAIDPDNTPLSPTQAQQYQRVLQAARLIDQYPEQQHLLQLMKEKYNISLTQLRNDIALARELFKTQHTFDYDFWHAWEIKDQLELIRQCRDAGDFKNWNAAKKHLRDIIGEKPPAVDDPRRMEKNIFYIQVNNTGQAQPVNIPLDQLRSLSPADRSLILQTISEPIDDNQAQAIFDS